MVRIFLKFFGVICYDNSFQRVTKTTSRIGALWNSSLLFDLFLTWWITAVLSKGCKPDNFESLNPLKHSFTNMPGLCSNFTKCKSFLESNSPDILALYEAKLDDSIDLGILSVTGYLPLIRKDSVTYMHGLAIYVKKGLLLHETYL